MLYEQQKNMLRFFLNLAPERPLEVVRMPEHVEPIHNAAGVDDGSPELQLTKMQMELAEKRIKTVRAGYLPTISLTGYAGGMGYHEKIRHFTDNWFGNCYIGISVKIPIFEANSKKLQIRQYGYEAQQAANRMESMRKQLDESYSNVVLQLNHNMEVFLTQTESRQQAENVYNVTEEQYKEGVASMTSLLQDEMQQRTAQAACVQAHCQCNLAQLDLLKLSGNLSQLSK